MYTFVLFSLEGKQSLHRKKNLMKTFQQFPEEICIFGVDLTVFLDMHMFVCLLTSKFLYKGLQCFYTKGNHR